MKKIKDILNQENLHKTLKQEKMTANDKNEDLVEINFLKAILFKDSAIMFF